MNLRNYIQGERLGKEAHQLERESMHDPFLYDAIEGYDLVDDKSTDHLKKIRKQIAKRSKKKSGVFPFGILPMFQLWTVAACVVGIIVLSGIFLLYNKTDVWEDGAYVENQEEDITVYNDTTVNIREVEAEAEAEVETKAEAEVKTDTLKVLLAEVKQNTIVQKEKTNTLLADKKTVSEKNSGTNKQGELSLSEKQDIFSKYANSEGTNKQNVTVQTPEPVVGEEAYAEYIEKNRQTLTNNNCESKHGKVILLFNVNEIGRPVDIVVLRSLCKAADKEAIRLLQNGSEWTANKKNVRWEVLF